MQRTTRIALAGAALVVLSMAVMLLTQSVTASTPRSPSGEVILMRCNTGGKVFFTAAYQGSSTAPSKRSDECPENLSLLLKEGFSIRDIGHYDFENDFVVYTLIR